MNRVSIPSSMSSGTYWQNINILFTKFNVVNKRLWGSRILNKRFCKPLKSYWIAPMVDIGKYSNDDVEHYMSNTLDLLELGGSNDCESSVELILIELTPKKFTVTKAYQLACLDKSNIITTFYNVTDSAASNLCPNFTYSLTLINNNIVLNSVTDINSKPHTWLAETVLPQFSKWSNESNQSFQICKESLSLIPKEKYYLKYNELKLKYGKHMVETWAEGTDPSKYVYEDVAIATYLLLLWEDGQTQPKKFVDLGCGNGLLVYILTKEGHDGIGIDIRKRKIWDTYSNDVKLEEKTIIPSNKYLFPDADWLIGNHSDELTPWIPVMAVRSSYKCNFFVLPCCAYNFDGTKYQRKDSSKSQYIEYIEYIRMISEYCGFDPKIDRLKIPSTKRICLVGQTKTYLLEKHLFVCNNINNLINKTSPLAQNVEKSWVANFKPRQAKEKVRNCTQISKTITQSIIDCVSSHLLQGCDLKCNWSAGKVVHINELVSLISEENLKAMKAECGGLQTLLKNNHHIFNICKGTVKLRYPRTEAEVIKTNNTSKRFKNKVKIQPCWFYNKHPQGCPLTDENCSYLHIKI